MKIAKADLVPTEANLLAEYGSFAELRGGVRGVLRAGQRPRAPGDPPRPGGDAGRGTRPAAPAARAPLHRGVRGDPHGAGEHRR